MQHMTAGFRLYDASHMGDIRENDSKRGACQVLGMFDFDHLDLPAEFPFLNQSFFCGCYRGMRLVMIQRWWWFCAVLVNCVPPGMKLGMGQTCFFLLHVGRGPGSVECPCFWFGFI